MIVDWLHDIQIVYDTEIQCIIRQTPHLCIFETEMMNPILIQNSNLIGRKMYGICLVPDLLNIDYNYMKYTKAELDFAVTQARIEWFQEWYELGRWHLQTIKDAPIINF